MKRRAVLLGAVAGATSSAVGLSLTSILSPSAFAANTTRAESSLTNGHRTVELTVGGQRREALLYLPTYVPTNVPTSADKDAAPRKPLPLVIMLHGMGGSAASAMTETDWSSKAQAAGFIVAYPEATRPDETKSASLGHNARAWNDGSGRFHAGERKVDDLGFIDALISKLIADFAVDSRHIFVTGFSNGASMAFRVGAMQSNRVAAIAPHSGACWTPELLLPRGLSVCYITGTADSLNPIAGGFPKLARSAKDQGGQPKPSVQATIDKWARANGCGLTAARDETNDGVRVRQYQREYRQEHVQKQPQEPAKSPAQQHLNPSSVVQLITIDGHGHHWAGGKSQAPEWLVGKNSSRLKATDAVWAFFQSRMLAAV